MNWTAKVEEDNETGDLVLAFPDDMLRQLGWVEGDTLQWIDNNDGTWSLRKAIDEV